MNVDNRTFMQEGGLFGSQWDENKEQADVKPVICDICLEIFTSQHEFTAHINSHYTTPNNKETRERDIKEVYHASDLDSTTVKYEPQDATSVQLSQETTNRKYQDEKTAVDVSEMLLEEDAVRTMKLVKKLEFGETSPISATDVTHRPRRLKKKKKKKKKKSKNKKHKHSSSIKRKRHNKSGDKAKKIKSVLVENGTMNGSVESSQQDAFYIEDDFLYDTQDETNSESSGDEWLPSSAKRNKFKKGSVPWRRKSDIKCVKPPVKCQDVSENFFPGDELYVCEQCNKAFKTMSALQNHLVGHDGSRMYKCTKCSKAFKRKQILEQHELRHSTERPFRCDHCGRGFKVKVDLSYHLLTHTDAELHRCLQCGRGFKRKQDLTRHFAVHTDYRPYACTMCEYKFKRKMDLVQHLEVHDEKRYTCDNCGNMFRRKDSLTKHVRLYCAYARVKVEKKTSSRGAKSQNA